VFLPSLVKIVEGEMNKTLGGIPDKTLSVAAFTLPLGGDTAVIPPAIY